MKDCPSFALDHVADEEVVNDLSLQIFRPLPYGRGSVVVPLLVGFIALVLAK